MVHRLFSRRLASTALVAALAAGAGTSLSACDRRPQLIQLAPSSPAEAHPQPGTMTVNGMATIDVSPDCADLTITLSADNVTPGVAVKAIDMKKLDLIAALQKLGVEVGQVKISTMELQPMYEPNREGWAQLKIRTYRASLTVTATTRDFAKLGDMMDAAGSAGAVAMSTAFRRSDLPEQKRKVREQALTAARDKANQTAATLGIHLGRITAVVENPGGYMWSSEYFPATATANVASVADAQGSVSIGGSLQPLTINVSLTYELPTST